MINDYLSSVYQSTEPFEPSYILGKVYVGIAPCLLRDGLHPNALLFRFFHILGDDLLLATERMIGWKVVQDDSSHGLLKGVKNKLVRE